MRHPIFFGFVATILAVACSSQSNSPEHSPFEDPSNAAKPPQIEQPTQPGTKGNLYWLSKAARLLRNGHGLSQQDDTQKLLSLPKEQVVEQFMRDLRFGDTVLDFNLYFLRQKLPQVREETKYTSSVFYHHAAIDSARQVLQGGDYLTLLSWNPPLFIDQSVEPFFIRGGEFEEGLTKAEKRQIFIQEYVDTANEIITWIQAHVEENGEIDKEALCRKAVETGDFGIYNAHLRLMQAGISNAFANGIALYWFEKLGGYCYSDGEFEDPIPNIREHRDRVADLGARVAEFDPENYPIQSVLDLRTLDKTRYNVKPVRVQFTQRFWGENQNSSTNFNRKRAATILSRYFCDDLNPIGFQEIAEHVEADRHASDPSCYSCHYKLDPVAGFFRDWGNFGFNYADREEIEFDDFAKLPKREFDANWLIGSDDSQEWNIGYIRSTTDSDLNDYGESLEDLFRIIQNAPEVRACLVKRMSEYFLGEETNIDAGYLDALTQKFNEEAKENSSQAFKNTVKRIVLSRTFTEQDVDPNVCYDFAPGAQPENQPPCEVAYLLKKNCVDCHGASSPAAGLDLSSWVPTADGSFTFPNGRVDRQTTFESIQERLSTNDPFDRMPLGKHMPNAEREKLYLWVERILTES